MNEQIVITETPSLSGRTPFGVGSVAQKTGEVAESMPWGMIIRYALIIIILAFLGFNLFTYLGKVIRNMIYWKQIPVKLNMGDLDIGAIFVKSVSSKNLTWKYIVSYRKKFRYVD